jgi:hypothetical protein
MNAVDEYDQCRSFAHQLILYDRQETSGGACASSCSRANTYDRRNLLELLARSSALAAVFATIPRQETCSRVDDVRRRFDLDYLDDTVEKRHALDVVYRAQSFVIV